MQELVTSAANPVVKRFRLLAADRKHRRRQRAFVVEGLQPVWRAVTAGWPVEQLLVAPQLLASQPARDMVAELERQGVPVARLSAELFGRLSDRDGPSGLAAIVGGGIGDLAGLPVRPDGVYLALHQLQNPGNIGTIVRTADAAGAAGVILLGNTADPLSATAVKASMGSLFAVPLAGAPGASELLAWAGEHGIQLVALSGAGSAGLWQAEFRRPLVVLLGNEGAGLPPELVADAALSVRIPMEGTAESLNVAAAAAIVLYELKRRTHC